MKVYLDDKRDPPDESWTLVRSFGEAVQLVNEHGFPDEVSFDHDLGLADWPNTGFDFAGFLIDLDLDTKTMPDNFTYQVHSANPVGAENIRGLMEGYLRFKREQQDH